jgi:hypothetical protein
MIGSVGDAQGSSWVAFISSSTVSIGFVARHHVVGRDLEVSPRRRCLGVLCGAPEGRGAGLAGGPTRWPDVRAREGKRFEGLRQMHRLAEAGARLRPCGAA